MRICVVSVEDEHGQLGGCYSRACINREIAEKHILEYFQRLSKDTFLLRDLREFTVKQIEATMQNEYSRWEYGGRFYIDFDEQDILES